MPLEHFNRITNDPGIMGGKPCIRGMRLTVGRIPSQIGAGETIEEIIPTLSFAISAIRRMACRRA